MTRTRSMLMLAMTIAWAGRLVLGQEPAAKNPAANNPHLGDPQSIRTGQGQYRTRCADCHGLDATGYRGPDLTALLASAAELEAICNALGISTKGMLRDAEAKEAQVKDASRRGAYVGSFEVK